MSFQGHIENGVVVFDEAVPLAEGTRVRIEAVDKPLQEPDSSERPVVDTKESYSVRQMAHAWTAITKPIPEDHVRLSVDPDEYPLF